MIVWPSNVELFPNVAVFNEVMVDVFIAFVTCNAPAATLEADIPPIFAILLDICPLALILPDAVI